MEVELNIYPYCRGNLDKPIPVNSCRQSQSDVYSAPDGQEWKLPLLVSLLAIRDENWEVLFDGDDEDEIQENDIQTLIEVTTN